MGLQWVVMAANRDAIGCNGLWCVCNGLQCVLMCCYGVQWGVIGLQWDCNRL